MSDLKGGAGYRQPTLGVGVVVPKRLRRWTRDLHGCMTNFDPQIWISNPLNYRVSPLIFC